jgi:LysR family transcriptional regulator for metE and metH
LLRPKGIHPRLRTAELTVAILQLVASRRGLTALPSWGVSNYVDYHYVVAKRIGKSGLWGELFAATTRPLADRAYVKEFLATLKQICFATLVGISPIARKV